MGIFNKRDCYHRSQAFIKEWQLEDKWRGEESKCSQWAEQDHRSCERREYGIYKELKGQCDWSTENSEQYSICRGLSLS